MKEKKMSPVAQLAIRQTMAECQRALASTVVVAAQSDKIDLRDGWVADAQRALWVKADKSGKTG
jgi:hypothetical protein